MNKHSKLETFLFLPPLLVFILYSYVGYFSRFMADDFCSINDARRFKMLRYIWHWYTTWGGRYSAIVSDELLVHIGPTGVLFMPGVLLVVWAFIMALASIVLVSKFVSVKIPASNKILLSLILLFALITISPDVQTVLYWWNGMRTYIPPLLAFTFHMAFIYWMGGKTINNQQTVWAAVFSFLIALFTGGFNETFTFMYFLFFAGLAGLHLIRNGFQIHESLFRLILAASFGALAALIIMLMSPGAAKRQDLFPAHPAMIEMANLVIRGYLQYLERIFTSLHKTSALASLLLTCLWLGAKSDQKTYSWLSALVVIVCGIAFCLASLFPSVYGMSQLPAARTFIIPSFILITSLACAGIMLGSRFSNRSDSTQPVLLFLALISVTLAGLINANAIYANRDRYISYARLYDQVDILVKQAHANGEESITIPALDNWANLDRPNEVARFWPTACYTEFYGIQVYGPPYRTPYSP